MSNRQLSVFHLQSGIRDNRDRGTVADFLKDKVQSRSKIAIISAYFTIYAFEALSQELWSIDHLDFLFGEPQFIEAVKTNYYQQGFKISEGKITDSDIQLTERLRQDKIARECEQWIREKVSIKSIKQSNLLHGKMYHIDNNGVNSAILGSSNFTVKGLGLANGNNNIELNLVVDSDRDRKDLKEWFNQLWDNQDLVKDVKDEVIAYLNKLYRDNPPEFIYYKTLYHLFKNFLAQQNQQDLLIKEQKLKNSQIWSLLFDFQRDGVLGAINKILNHNGCILADSVGLGKTFEALAIIKYFQNMNKNVLVLCPKKLRSNWTMYQGVSNNDLNILREDKFNYTVLSHTDLSRYSGYTGDTNLEGFHWDSYDLIVIDESHNFRNNTKGKDDKFTRYERLLFEAIQAGIPTKILLLSATPVNTDLEDLGNQINLITAGEDAAFRESFRISSIKQTLKTAQKEFTIWAKQKNRQSNYLLDNLNSAFFTLLDGLTIARSRKHIQRYYQDSLEQLGGFPERVKPISLFSHIDLENSFMDYDDINQEISSYQLSLFKPSNYVKEAYKSLYEGKVIQNNFTQSNRESYLIGMMKVNFLKRLESSVYSFKITLERTIEKIKKLENTIKNFDQYQTEIVKTKDLEIESFEDEELQAAFEVGKDLKYKLQHLDIDKWLVDLAKDRRQLHKLYLQAKNIDLSRDAKLAKLKELIAEKVTKPTVNKEGKENKKVIVFTAFADTAKYLYEALEGWVTTELRVNIALVTGGNGGNQTSFGSNKFEHILTNFSPKSKKREIMKSMPQDEEIDLLIATDCISEGQNLQDCDYLVNYDIHWNPVRIIQRFGRIDRIGSVNNKVQLVNFWPTEDLNKYINLKNRVEARMALVDIAATGDDNLLNMDELQELLTEEISYRDKQLLRLKDEVSDIEDFNESVSLTEFTLDDFRIDLHNYLNNSKEELENAPLGLYGVVPPHPDYDVIKRGIIFCLEQKNPLLTTVVNQAEYKVNEQANPLQPYFLVYVKNNGEVNYTFTQPKQILEIYRLLCTGKTKAYKDLCQLFNQRTSNGSNMSKESDLLDKAINSITRTSTKRIASNLFNSGKGGVTPLKQQQVTKITDFELVTWLIIQDDTAKY